MTHAQQIIEAREQERQRTAIADALEELQVRAEHVHEQHVAPGVESNYCGDCTREHELPIFVGRLADALVDAGVIRAVDA